MRSVYIRPPSGREGHEKRDPEAGPPGGLRLWQRTRALPGEGHGGTSRVSPAGHKDHNTQHDRAAEKLENASKRSYPTGNVVRLRETRHQAGRPGEEEKNRRQRDGFDVHSELGITATALVSKPNLQAKINAKRQRKHECNREHGPTGDSVRDLPASSLFC